MKKVLISAGVVVLSALIMLVIQLHWNGWQLAEVDVQKWVVASGGLIAAIYLAVKYTPKKNDKDKK